MDVDRDLRPNSSITGRNMAASTPKNTPESNRPEDPRTVPDPARSYGREKPQHESGMGRLDNNEAVPTDRPDRQEGTVNNKQGPRQINAQDEPDHSMMDEEPLGEDTMPTDIHEKRNQRHPRREGKGGTP